MCAGGLCQCPRGPDPAPVPASGWSDGLDKLARPLPGTLPPARARALLGCRTLGPLWFPPTCAERLRPAARSQALSQFHRGGGLLLTPLGVSHEVGWTADWPGGTELDPKTGLHLSCDRCHLGPEPCQGDGGGGPRDPDSSRALGGCGRRGTKGHSFSPGTGHLEADGLLESGAHCPKVLW